MSRWIEVDADLGRIRETIESMELCRHRINDVCCNDEHPDVAAFVDDEMCMAGRCPFFLREDGVIYGMTGGDDAWQD